MNTIGETPGTQPLLHFLELIAAAEAPAAVLSAVQEYLNAWPMERIANLQRVDGGWAPFDHDQTPSQVDDVADLRRFRDAVSSQCIALKQARLQLIPEITELDEILFIAVQLVESMKVPEFRARARPARRGSPLLNLL